MFSGLIRQVSAVKAKIPLMNQLHLNFILLHYVYLISWTIIGSILIYPGSSLAYIDALFFASGAATQSGLNTVNLNAMSTYQQIVLYCICMLTTPIFIHGALVFIRLYWFEKRFQHVVQDARAVRRSRSRGRTFSTNKDAPDYNREEMGVGNRAIVVLRNRNGEAQGEELAHRVVKTTDGFNSLPESPDGKGESSRSSGDHDSSTPPDGRPALSLAGLRVPTQLSPEHHIAFLENQRRNTGALRIPSPREYDRGGVPQALEEDADGAGNAEANRTGSAEQHEKEESTRRSDSSDDDSANIGPTDNPHITINEPELQRSRTRMTSTFPRVESRPTFRETKDLNDPAILGRSGTNRRPTFSNVFSSLTQEKERPTLPYLSWNATVGRNSNFVDLTEEQRDELGGIEYRALKTLALVLICYYVCFHIFGIISLMPWILTKSHWGSVITADGQGRPWWAIFTSMSAFNDLGFTLTPDSMNSFQTAVWPLLVMTFLIIIGNTGFPCMLRFTIWVISTITPKGSSLWEELKFLLDHPRRCFTLLFPRNATWWLFAILVLLNGIDLIFFIVLDLNDPTVTSIAPGYRFLDGLFQAASTRTAGFGVVDIGDLHPAIQVSYLIMMYISVFPIAISMRRTNVYEEKSLGIYSGADEEEDDESEHNNAPSYIGAHLRKQLSFDLWYVFLGLFIIAIAEGSRLMDMNDYSFQLFTVLFEVVSAYGTVGLSMGYPGVDTSFSAQFNVVSKLVIIAMQIRGRHRGLPYALDRAILLPSESLNTQEAHTAERRGTMRRRASNLSQMSRQSRQSQSQSQQHQPQQQQIPPQYNGVSTGLDTQDTRDQTNPSGNALFQRHSTLR
ncbi:hypothetical protein ASPZODRAFT_60309 [Penicilliopsis zonata CBS 506.65]|uniref:Potassium transport protein n=1 Tax=Penicilliopsis zonata CBS 506.65 TaxID=1073090 RepID=A0A1L9SPP0_9EURO|nr:hypothetical protein ASPZODRAFT_60309 [Penicilliopsis zonata CBS 506.65]OJJ49024.1 hypothetical protein ASPZODRAFT_60309 [Penicilliopsis zonata CBS 506.65]